jgi:hypothetical protein
MSRRLYGSLLISTTMAQNDAVRHDVNGGGVGEGLKGWQSSGFQIGSAEPGNQFRHDGVRRN